MFQTKEVTNCNIKVVFLMESKILLEKSLPCMIRKYLQKVIIQAPYQTLIK